MRVGLTGGVGSGKSTVAALFAEHGAVVIDADELAREVVEPGTPGFDAVVARVRRRTSSTDGASTAPALAAHRLRRRRRRARELNAIVHPLVGGAGGRAEPQAAGDDAVVVYDVPLLVENDMAAGFDVVVVVEAPVELRLARLAGRGMAEDDARARMAARRATSSAAPWPTR